MDQRIDEPIKHDKVNHVRIQNKTLYRYKPAVSLTTSEQG